MRPQTLAAPAALLLALAACAPTVSADHHASEYRRLSDDCTARGGVLSPTGQQTGRPQTENVCTITGGASRLTAGS